MQSYASVPTWNFSANETAQPYLQTTSIGGGSIGPPYASFLLGLADSASLPSLPAPFYRKTSWGLYVQGTAPFVATSYRSIANALDENPTAASIS